MCSNQLIAAGCLRATRFSPAGDKIMRLHAETATIENGFVWLPQEALWLADYLAEFAALPRGRHDDQVDSTAQALAWTKLRPGGAGDDRLLAGAGDAPSYSVPRTLNELAITPCCRYSRS